MSDTTMNTLDIDKPLLRSLLVMGAVVEARDAYTGGHLWRVSQYAKLLAEQAGLSRQEVFLTAAGGFLHDLGKIGIPDAILNKPAQLSDEEYATIKTHPVIGRDLLREHPLASLAMDAISYHHERPDGQGYPYRLNDAETPLIARIVAIADAFDAMTSTRPYRQGMPVEKALTIIGEERGRQFNEMLCDHFLALAATGRLHHIVAHSFHERPLVTCPMCGPVIAVSANAEDGGLHYCRVCSGEVRLHRSGDSFVAEATGQQARPDQVRPQSDPDPIAELLAEESRPHSAAPTTPAVSPAIPAKPPAAPPGKQWVLILQLDPDQSEVWRKVLVSMQLQALVFPADSDLEIGLRIMATENKAPDLVLVDVAYFLARNANPYAFAGWLARRSLGTRLVLTNSAATRIVDSVRMQATRRGAIDLLPALPDDHAQAQATALKVIEEALRQPPPPVESTEEENSMRNSGSLADVAGVMVALRGPGGVAIQDRSYRFKTYPRCFIGSEAAEWLRRTYKVSRQDALKFGSGLIARRIIHHVADDHDFKDENLFYRFIVDEVLAELER